MFEAEFRLSFKAAIPQIICCASDQDPYLCRFALDALKSFAAHGEYVKVK